MNCALSPAPTPTCKPTSTLRRIGAAAIVAAACTLPGQAIAAPGGPIHTLPIGTYLCELPGDALGPAGERVPSADFAITHGSSYRTATGTGFYLLTGQRLTVTSGPMKGKVFHHVGGTFLRIVKPDGQDGPLRCVRRGGRGGE